MVRRKKITKTTIKPRVFKKPRIIETVERVIRPMKPSSSEVYMTRDACVAEKLQDKFTFSDISKDAQGKIFTFNASKREVENYLKRL